MSRLCLIAFDLPLVSARVRWGLPIAVLVASLGLQSCGGAPESAEATPPTGGTSPTPDTSPPSAPAGLSATPISATQINLSWTAATDNVGVVAYLIERCLGATCLNFAQIWIASGAATTFSDNTGGLVQNTTFRYRVQAADAVPNTGPFSNVANVTTPADVTAPVVSSGAPTGTLAAGTTQAIMSVVTNESATCRWDTSAATSYAAMPNNFTTTGGTFHSTQLTGLADAMTYTRYVRCLDLAGNANSSSYTVSFSVGTGGGPITLSLIASRISGVAPLAVFFDATGTTSPSTTRPFHELEYRWDFGDPAGGATWNFGSRAGVSNKNGATGPLAAHLFEMTGTYTVTLTVTDGTNTDTATVLITVDNPDDVFAATNTVCIGATTLPVGGFDGCPAGADGLQQANFNTAVSTQLSAGRRRLLFRRGDIFSSTATARIAVNGPGIIGAYGPGVAKALVTGGGGHDRIVLGNSTNHAFADWRFVDLDIDGGDSAGSKGVFADGAAAQITFLNCIFRNLDVGIQTEIAILPLAAAVWNQWAIVGNRFISNINYSYLGSMVNSAALGNQITGQGGQHAWRMGYHRKLIISNNEFTGTSTGSALTLRGARWGDPSNHPSLPAQPYSEETIVSDNRLIAHPQGNAVTYMSANTGENVHFRNHLFERNWLSMSDSGAVLTTSAGLSTIRNNLIERNGTIDLRSIEVQRTSDPINNSYFVYNNTAFSAGATSTVSFSIVHINSGQETEAGSSPPSLVARNNLGVAPSNTHFQTAPVINSAGAGFTASNNSTTAQIQGASPLTTTPPTQPSHWRPQAGSYPINGGTAVPVFSDFFAAPRAGNHIGAVNP